MVEEYKGVITPTKAIWNFSFSCHIEDLSN